MCEMFVFVSVVYDMEMGDGGLIDVINTTCSWLIGIGAGSCEVVLIVVEDDLRAAARQANTMSLLFRLVVCDGSLSALSLTLKL